MSDIESIEDVEKDLGRPVLTLIPTQEVEEDRRLVDDIANEYRLYCDDRAAGGCIMYGRYDRGWVVNPSARWPLYEMANMLQELQLAIEPFTKSFEAVRDCHQPQEGNSDPEELQKILDDNECLPAGTNIGDWRRLANSFKLVFSHKDRDEIGGVKDE